MKTKSTIIKEQQMQFVQSMFKALGVNPKFIDEEGKEIKKQEFIPLSEQKKSGFKGSTRVDGTKERRCRG